MPLRADDSFLPQLARYRDARLQAEEHVLAMAMEHMISDAFSMSILWGELFKAYMQLSTGRAITLPQIPLQFVEYATAQRRAQQSWEDKHGLYWSEHLKGCQRARFPTDARLPTPPRAGWGFVPVEIGRDLKTGLREWCRLRKTTLVMSVFTAYVGLVLRWCKVPEAVIQYQTDGRSGPRSQHTIGYFASALSLRVRLLPDDSFMNLMSTVTQEYCNACDHADYSYLDAQVPRPEFTRNSCFNWVPRGPGTIVFEPDESDGSLGFSPFAFDHPVLRSLDRDTEPMILFFETDEEVHGGVQFPLDRFSVETMEKFARSFMVFLGALLTQPESQVSEITLET